MSENSCFIRNIRFSNVELENSIIFKDNIKISDYDLNIKDNHSEGTVLKAKSNGKSEWGTSSSELFATKYQTLNELYAVASDLDVGTIVLIEDNNKLYFKKKDDSWAILDTNNELPFKDDGLIGLFTDESFTSYNNWTDLSGNNNHMVHSNVNPYDTSVTFSNKTGIHKKNWNSAKSSSNVNASNSSFYGFTNNFNSNSSHEPFIKNTVVGSSYNDNRGNGYFLFHNNISNAIKTGDYTFIHVAKYHNEKVSGGHHRRKIFNNNYLTGNQYWRWYSGFGGTSHSTNDGLPGIVDHYGAKFDVRNLLNDPNDTSTIYNWTLTVDQHDRARFNTIYDSSTMTNDHPYLEEGTDYTNTISNATNSNKMGVSNNSNERLAINSWKNGEFPNSDWAIAFMAIWNRKLTTDEIKDVENYLVNNYGLTYTYTPELYWTLKPNETINITANSSQKTNVANFNMVQPGDNPIIYNIELTGYDILSTNEDENTKSYILTNNILVELDKISKTITLNTNNLTIPNNNNTYIVNMGPFNVTLSGYEEGYPDVVLSETITYNIYIDQKPYINEIIENKNDTDTTYDINSLPTSLSLSHDGSPTTLTINGIDPDNQIMNYDIVVQSKTTSHPYYSESGSSNSYFINGNEAPSINLVRQKVYRFYQNDQSNINHPFLIYTDANKTTQYTTNVTTIGTPGSTGSYTEITVDNSTPSTLYYQCQNHAYMGYQLVISNNDTDVELITYSYTTQNLGVVATVNNTNNVFTITPNNNFLNNGTFMLNITLNDGINTNQYNISFVLNIPNGGQPPYLNSIIQTINDVSTTFTEVQTEYVLDLTDGIMKDMLLTFNAVDPEGLPVTYTLTDNSNSNANVSLNSNIVTISPDPNISENYIFGIIIHATDGVNSINIASSIKLQFIIPNPETHILGYGTTKITNVDGSVNGIATVSGSREDNSYISPDFSALAIFQYDRVANYNSYPSGYPGYPWGILDSATSANPFNVYVTWETPQKVTHYHWRSRNWSGNNTEDRAPTQWTVQVKINGTWTTIHTIPTEDSFGKAHEETYYWKIPEENQVSAREYRWRITDTTHGSNYLHISRMRIYSGLNDPHTNPLHSPESDYINSSTGSFIVPDLIPHRHILGYHNTSSAHDTYDSTPRTSPIQGTYDVNYNGFVDAISFQPAGTASVSPLEYDWDISDFENAGIAPYDRHRLGYTISYNSFTQDNTYPYPLYDTVFHSAYWRSSTAKNFCHHAFFTFKIPHLVTHINIEGWPGGTVSPREWIISGKNDDGNWVTLQVVSNACRGGRDTNTITGTTHSRYYEIGHNFHGQIDLGTNPNPNTYQSLIRNFPANAPFATRYYRIVFTDSYTSNSSWGQGRRLRINRIRFYSSDNIDPNGKF